MDNIHKGILACLKKNKKILLLAKHEPRGYMQNEKARHVSKWNLTHKANGGV